MPKKFGGFNQEQMGLIAQKMGFKGPLHKFSEFLNASPDKAAELGRTTSKAIELFDNAQKFASGGVIKAKGQKEGKYTVKYNGLWYKEKDAIKKGWKPDKKTTTTTKTTTKTTPSVMPTVATPKTNTVTASNKTQEILKNPTKAVTEADTTKIKTNANQFVDKNSGQVKTTATAKTPTDPTATTAAAPKATKANTYNATEVADDVNKVVDNTQAVKGTVSDKAQVEAATALPSKNATVQGQLEGLMKQFEGGETPAWAAGAMRMANTAMAARGLGSSSMAGGAITQAAMESAISIAATDAATFSAFEMQNLTNQQQARLQNAQAFLQMDLANLDVENQTNLFKSQSQIQALFTDQAADNAAKQFNASSKNQTDQFFAQLKSQVQQFNAAQQNAMKTSNADRKSTLDMFNTEQKNQMAQFNATNRLIIDQANAKWRQTIATTDAAEQNENNRLNAQLLTNMTTQAYNNLWQTERDLMSFAFTAGQNEKQRAHEVVLQKLVNKNGGSSGKQAVGQSAGNLIGTIITKGAGALVDKAVGSIF